MVTVDGNTSQLVFRLALHMPELAANLISIGKFDDLGFSVTFKGGKANFTNPAERTFMTGEKRNRMYLLELQGTQGEGTAHCQVPIASVASAPA